MSYCLQHDAVSMGDQLLRHDTSLLPWPPLATAIVIRGYETPMVTGQQPVCFISSRNMVVGSIIDDGY